MTALVRQATSTDALGLAAILNRIIAIGGTTAHETPFTEDDFALHYLTGTDALSCFLAQDDQGMIGFQVLGLHPDLPPNWADIGTFVSSDRQRTGVGAALFAATLTVARARDTVAINATIRADNVPGLGYYARRGFVPYGQDPDYCLQDGTRVARIHKRFDL